MTTKRILAISLAIALAGIAGAQARRVVTGDERTELYLPLLAGKRVALFANHTSVAGSKHIADLLHDSGVSMTAIFAPEHGFRGSADAGELIDNSFDEKTSTPIVSLYGGNADKAMESTGFDILIVDIQDVGLRFYTYYVTMWRLMNFCARTGREVVVLDRPNPNGFYVDGPILDMRLRSGVGWLPIPTVYGMTLGELARMINGEGWLDDGKKCTLRVIPCKNYRRHTRAEISIPPSPNLPNMKAIYLYPSTCYFEGTVVSLGRGTSKPFQVYGHPDMKGCDFSFTPRSVPGAKNPPLLGQLCHGRDLSAKSSREICREGINLEYVIDAYRNLGMGGKFFTPFFDKLAGQTYIREMIMQGRSAAEIKAMWKGDVEKFMEQRKPYLIYGDGRTKTH